ncbi:MAG: lactate utilization protein [Nitrososphaerota archaeon]|nr:lactate utilization protein [Nitrososphaerota archaeon]MDG6921918.1 lactate utilization protein [Nitrososphaerota archaeon]
MALPNTNIEEFSSRFIKQAGKVYFAKSAEDTTRIINGIIEERGKGDSCCSSNLRIRQNGSMVDISGRVKTNIWYSQFEEQPRKFADQLDVGVTHAEYGIAETGSIVDVAYTDEERLLSSITRVHIALLDSSNVLPNLDDLASRIRETLSAKQDHPKPSITFIGGPSRTSDIELKSVLGVHGPHEVHVVIY